MSTHRPRKRKGLDNGAFGRVPKTSEALVNSEGPAFPLVAFLWPAKGSSLPWAVLPLILLAVGLFRWTTGFWGYSGFQSPPMHGDFEAQRHWLEITTHLPISRWYFHDLEWWGLDYPPLTAYHSWLLGKVGNLIEPSWFALYVSRGLDDHLLKVYMRATVLLSDYSTYVPGIIVFLRRYSRIEGVSLWESSIALVAILMQPATILIDHGHFQYNTVMLGFVLGSMSCMVWESPVWSCAFFVAALGFKQMALFYAPAVFAYLLGVCIFPRIRIGRFTGIALVTVVSFGLLFAPIALAGLRDSHYGIPPPDAPLPPLMLSLPVQLDKTAWYYQAVLQLAQAIHRIFPFARGLFEDKVANLWCAIHTFHKLHQYPSAIVQRAALLATTITIIPPCLLIFFKPRKQLLPLAFATTAWGFFLCSYQVHEKNVLLPLLPMTLLLAGEGGLSPSMRSWVGLANMLGVWTLYPLLQRDQLRVPYFTLTLLWAYLLGLPPTSLSAYASNEIKWPTKLLHLSFYLAMIVWHAAEGFVAPPSNKPDMWVVLNVLVGAAGFGVCYLWCLWMLVKKSGLVGSSKPLAKKQ
ncbi:glycosyltransferase family 57 protein [Aulographum hederae CBS 113979]|uniref:Alpha-1,3-glucosyltransferase n=1 Tax=Aulographum hederae CBS 113979 TaxID=1176131 RepID=A0A6G1GYW6_9PEZI|nr:glycosyltransferase family 57 protein [Aulographum hederae CBS 113979]